MITPLESKRFAIQAALEENGLLPGRDLHLLISEYAYDFRDINAYALGLLKKTVVIIDSATFSQLVLAIVPPFSTYISRSQEDKEDKGQFALCKATLNRIARNNLNLIQISAISTFLIKRFETPQNPLALALRLRDDVNKLYRLKVILVNAYNLFKCRIELMAIYQLLPERLKGMLNTDKKLVLFSEADFQGLADRGGANVVAFCFALADGFQKTKDVRTKEDLQQLEQLQIPHLKKLAQEVAQESLPEYRIASLKYVNDFIYALHLIAHITQRLHNLESHKPMWLDTKKERAALVTDSFLRVLWPEVGQMAEALLNGTYTDRYTDPEGSIRTCLSLCAPFEAFEQANIEREFTYQFLYTMLQRQEGYLTKEERDSYGTALAALPPNDFAALKPSPIVTMRQAHEKMKAILGLYTVKPTVAESFAPVIKKQKPILPKIKKKKKNDFLEAAAPKDVKGQEPPSKPIANAATATAAAAAPAPPPSPFTAIFAARTVDVKALRYHNRVQENLSKPKAAGTTRENTWAHGFTQALDQFLGTTYCVVEETVDLTTNKKESHYVMIVMVEDEEGPQNKLTNRPFALPYLATYTVHEGLCFHRCLQKKSLFEVYNQIANDQIFKLVEWPPLPAAAAAVEAQSSGTHEMQLDPITKIVTLRDTKHNITLKVLPWPK